MGWPISGHLLISPNMLAIRLKRVGRTNDPSFRIIVQDHRRSPKKTRGVVEYVGSYDARKGKPQVNAERIQYWLSQGAQASDTVHNILVDSKVISDKKVNAHNKKTKVVKEVPVEKPKPVVAAKEEIPVAEEKVEVPAEPMEAPTVTEKIEVVTPEEAPIVEEEIEAAPVKEIAAKEEEEPAA